jgi:hypothetical protein
MALARLSALCDVVNSGSTRPVATTTSATKSADAAPNARYLLDLAALHHPNTPEGRGCVAGRDPTSAPALGLRHMRANGIILYSFGIAAFSPPPLPGGGQRIAA